MRARHDWFWLLIGLESGANFTNQSQSVVTQNQSKREIVLDSQLKTTPTKENIEQRAQKFSYQRFSYLYNSVYFSAGHYLVQNHDIRVGEHDFNRTALDGTKGMVCLVIASKSLAALRSLEYKNTKGLVYSRAHYNGFSQT